MIGGMADYLFLFKNFLKYGMGHCGSEKTLTERKPNGKGSRHVSEKHRRDSN